MTEPTTLPATSLPGPEDADALRRRVAKLERINAALMAHVERSTDQRGGAYALFQTAITLEGRIRARTEEMAALMHRLERSNAALGAAKEEAETANRSKTRFLAAASHDLLQPLNAARLSISALADLPLGPEARLIGTQVERGLQTIEDLIKTLLDISKLDAGIVRPQVRPVALPDLLAGLAASFAPFAARKGLRLAVRGPDLAVASDGLLLRRILQNLLSNAIRYTADGGVALLARRRAGAVRIDVLDTGCGIAADEHALVFDEFYRGRAEGVGPARAAGEADGPGLGLGLSIVRRMALALDHPLALASRPGHGTRVSLTVPTSDRPAAAEVVPMPVATRLSGARVVIVENDAGAAEALARLLRTWDARVTAFRDRAGVAAALDAGGLDPDLLILDYHLDDGACGLDVAATLRAGRTAPLPVIVTTADHAPEIAAEAARRGAELVHKPIRPAQLRALLAYMLA